MAFAPPLAQLAELLPKAQTRYVNLPYLPDLQAFEDLFLGSGGPEEGSDPQRVPLHQCYFDIGATDVKCGKWADVLGGSLYNLRQRTVTMTRILEGGPQKVVQNVSWWTVDGDKGAANGASPTKRTASGRAGSKKNFLIRIRTGTPEWYRAKEVVSIEYLLVSQSPSLVSSGAPSAAAASSSSSSSTPAPFSASSGGLLLTFAYDLEVARSGLGLFIPLEYAKTQSFGSMRRDRDAWLARAEPLCVAIGPKLAAGAAQKDAMLQEQLAKEEAERQRRKSEAAAAAEEAAAAAATEHRLHAEEKEGQKHGQARSSRLDRSSLGGKTGPTRRRVASTSRSRRESTTDSALLETTTPAASPPRPAPASQGYDETAGASDTDSDGAGRGRRMKRPAPSAAASSSSSSSSSTSLGGAASAPDGSLFSYVASPGFDLSSLVKWDFFGFGGTGGSAAEKQEFGDAARDENEPAGTSDDEAVYRAGPSLGIGPFIIDPRTKAEIPLGSEIITLKAIRSATAAARMKSKKDGHSTGGGGGGGSVNYDDLDDDDDDDDEDDDDDTPDEEQEKDEEGSSSSSFSGSALLLRPVVAALLSSLMPSLSKAGTAVGGAVMSGAETAVDTGSAGYKYLRSAASTLADSGGGLVSRVSSMAKSLPFRLRDADAPAESEAEARGVSEEEFVSVYQLEREERKRAKEERRAMRRRERALEKERQAALRRQEEERAEAERSLRKV